MFHVKHFRAFQVDWDAHFYIFLIRLFHVKQSPVLFDI